MVKFMPLLVGFTIPLVLGNLFQLTYNAVDSIIVGQFVGKEDPCGRWYMQPCNDSYDFILKWSVYGCEHTYGTQFGAKDYNKLQRQISTTMLSGTVFSAILSLCCIIFSRPILKLLQVDPSIMDLTVSYMRIIFLGLLFTFLYNFFSSTLRALGDSQTPLYFLIASSLLNIFGDLFFVIVLKMGSNGCAISTVISEMMCCVFCIYTYKSVSRY